MIIVRSGAKSLLLLGGLVGLCVRGAPAPVPPVPVSNTWTIENAVQRALDVNPDFVASKLEYERQRGIRVQVRARMLPQVVMSASAEDRDDRLIDRTPQDFQQAPNARSVVAPYSYEGRLEIRQILFDGLESWNQAKRYKALEEQSRLTMEATALRTVALVRQAYDAVLWRRAALQREADRVAALRQLAATTARRQAAGEIAEYEKLRAEAEFRLAESDYVQAKSNVARAEQTFRRQLLLPAAGDSLVLDGALQPRTLPWTVDEAVVLARKRRPDLAAASAALTAAEAGVRSTRGGYLPKIEVYAAYNARTSYFDETRRLEGWSAGAALRWPLFDGLETRGRMRVSLAERKAAAVHLDDVNFQIDSQLKEFFAGLELSRSAVEAQRLAVDLARRSVTQARRLHEIGQTSLEQVLEAEVSSRRAELGFLEAIFNHNSTVAQIEFAVGGNLATENGVKR